MDRLMESAGRHKVACPGLGTYLLDPFDPKSSQRPSWAEDWDGSHPGHARNMALKSPILGLPFPAVIFGAFILPP